MSETYPLTELPETSALEQHPSSLYIKRDALRQMDMENPMSLQELAELRAYPELDLLFVIHHTAEDAMDVAERIPARSIVLLEGTGGDNTYTNFSFMRLGSPEDREAYWRDKPLILQELENQASTRRDESGAVVPDQQFIATLRAQLIAKDCLLARADISNMNIFDHQLAQAGVRLEDPHRLVTSLIAEDILLSTYRSDPSEQHTAHRIKLLRERILLVEAIHSMREFMAVNMADVVTDWARNRTDNGGIAASNASKPHISAVYGIAHAHSLSQRMQGSGYNPHTTICGRAQDYRGEFFSPSLHKLSREEAFIKLGAAAVRILVSNNEKRSDASGVSTYPGVGIDASLSSTAIRLFDDSCRQTPEQRRQAPFTDRYQALLRALPAPEDAIFRASGFVPRSLGSAK